MAILYYDEKKLFQLNTENTTYVIGLSPEGYVGHVYYGPFCTESRICIRSAWMSRRSPRPSIREKSSFLDRFPMEYPTGGVGDYRESLSEYKKCTGPYGM